MGPYEILTLIIAALTMLGTCCTPCLTAMVNIMTIRMMHKMKFAGADKEEVMKETIRNLV